jgi:hypothetical protein
MKKFTFKGVLDGFRSSAPQPPRVDQEIIETLRPDHFAVAKASIISPPYRICRSPLSAPRRRFGGPLVSTSAVRLGRPPLADAPCAPNARLIGRTGSRALENAHGAAASVLF